MGSFMEWIKNCNWKIIFVTIISAITYIFLWNNTIKIGSKEDMPITYLTSIGACILGWIIAIITTPYGKDDTGNIGKFTKIVGSFLSGYLLSKFDKVLEKAITPEIILSNLCGARLLLFACYFGITWIFVFSYRQYTRLN